MSTQNLGVTPSSLSLSLVDALQVAAKHGCQSQGQGWVLREYERVGKNKLGVLITNYPYGDRTTTTGPPCMLLETLDRELLIMGKLILMWIHIVKSLIILKFWYILYTIKYYSFTFENSLQYHHFLDIF